jgi:hypothetical protein
MLKILYAVINYSGCYGKYLNKFYHNVIDLVIMWFFLIWEKAVQYKYQIREIVLGLSILNYILFQLKPWFLYDNALKK